MVTTTNYKQQVFNNKSDWCVCVISTMHLSLDLQHIYLLNDDVKDNAGSYTHILLKNALCCDFSTITLTSISATITITSFFTLNTCHSHIVCAFNLSKNNLSTWDPNWYASQYIYTNIVDADPSSLISRLWSLNFAPVRWVPQFNTF